MKKTTKQLLFERMHTVGGMPLREDINDFYHRNNIDPDDLNYLGSGDYGKAYSIDGSRVLKITSSKNEYELAKEIMSGNYPSFVDIYDTTEGNNEYYIVMEELDIDSHVEDLYYELQNVLDSQELPIQYVHYFDEEEYEGEISDELQNFINDIEDINHDYRRLGIEASDIQPNNLGYDMKTGKLKAFDIQDKAY